MRVHLQVCIKMRPAMVFDVDLNAEKVYNRRINIQ